MKFRAIQARANSGCSCPRRHKGHVVVCNHESWQTTPEVNDVHDDDYDGKHIDNSKVKLTPGIRVVRAAKSHSTIIKLFREDGGGTGK